MGLNADILKANGRSYAGIGGTSTYFDRVCIVNVDGPFEPTQDCFPVMLVRGNLPGTVKAVMACPIETMPVQWTEVRPPNAVGPMHGGCYIESSDSRFGEAVAALGGPRYAPVAFHDRFETPEQYRALSA